MSRPHHPLATLLALLALAGLALGACSRPRGGGGGGGDDDDDSASQDDDDVGDDDDASFDPQGEPLQWIFTSGFDANDAALGAAVLAVDADLIDALDLGGELTDRTLELEALTDADIDGVDHPDGDVGDLLGVAVAGSSEASVQAHEGLVLLEERTAIVPGSPNLYTRTFPGGDDACWSAGSCDLLEAEDTFRNENLLMEIDGERSVEVRRLVLSDGRRALVERAWLPEAALTDSGDRGLRQEYRVAVILGESVPTRRLTAVWFHLDPGITMDPELLLNVTAAGLADALEAEDAYLAGR